MADQEAHGNQAGLNPAPDGVEEGRLLFAREARFIWGATRIDGLPPEGAPEVAIAGRSNVGKSSLLNALTGRGALARTSATPGHTRQLNFFDLDGRIVIVDLPGYGYAKAPKGQVKDWNALIDAYLRGRRTLTRALLLIDARHGLKDNDRRAMALMDKAAVVYQIVLTKADAPEPGELARTIAAVTAEAARHTAAFPEIAVTSSRTGEGIPALRAALAAIAVPE